MRDELRAGARLFNEGHFWEAHEAWEDVWARSTGSERAFAQALILLAAAMHKRRAHGSLTARNFHKAMRLVATLPDVYDGVDLGALTSEVWAALHDQGRAPRLPE
ncbi:DUF309 domain-containing protein [Deinococcus pimensis]|uniref:DUF309 domain-containing protein n=1 Tax=Deinococcus pimensis TaxID=309888 RepID=UPI000481C923|nr:DUF309 domain-containing protein [Deinococcus pimensis]